MPTRKTLFWLIGASCLYLIAWNVGSGWLYILALLLAALPIASIIISRVNISRVTVELRAPASVSSGEDLPVSVEISNASLLPRFFLDIDIKYAGSKLKLFLPALGSRESRLVEIGIDDPRRGFFPGADVRLSSAAPAGLARRRRRLKAEAPLLVFPHWHKLASDWVTGQKNSGYMVSSAIPTRNTASDYLGVRDYRSGDSPRSIHWRTAARTGSLAVIEYARQTAITPVFLVDTFADGEQGEGTLSTFETAVTIAASLAQRESSNNRRSAIGFSPTDAAIRGLENSSLEAMRWLAEVQADSKKPMDLSLGSLPWPEVTPVLLLTSHGAYADMDRSQFLQAFPYSIVIMLDGSRFGDSRRSRFMNASSIEKLTGRLETIGVRFLLVTGPDEVPFCLTDL
ncbi:MAG: DUF58 domain-containing protein [Actinobacteria bacterium]|nr:DUF58 domain-containing protein [Actinomycetota bacterium]